MLTVDDVVRALQIAVIDVQSDGSAIHVRTLIDGGEVYMAMQDLLCCAADNSIPLTASLLTSASELVRLGYALDHPDAVEMRDAIARIPVLTTA